MIKINYLSAGICTVQETFIFEALLDVTTFQSHPDISPAAPVTKKLSVDNIVCTCCSGCAVNLYEGPGKSFSSVIGVNDFDKLKIKIFEFLY